MKENPKVFISYSHQGSEYENKVLEFANHLRAEGFDANIDLYEESPSEGWPRWMENQISSSDYTLIVCSKSYYEKCYSETEKSKGISWEVNIIYQQLYDSSTINKKFIPVYFEKQEEQYILTPLKSFTYYNIGEKEEFDKLYWRIRGISKTNKPPLGNLRPLPKKEQKTMFYSTPIDLDKWNKAKWKGMLYLFYPGHIPALGLLYDNYEAGKSIFNEWKRSIKNVSPDSFIRVDFVIPPFPTKCWIHSDKDRSFGRGYFVHIGPNIDESIKRALDAGISKEEVLIATVSRYQWMDEQNGTKSRDLFEQMTLNQSGYQLLPIGIKNINKPITEDNIIIDFEYAIHMRHVTFKKGIESNDQVCKTVLSTPETPR